MSIRFRAIVLVACALLAPAAPLCAQETTNMVAPPIKPPKPEDKDMTQAKALFEKYVKLENDFDPAVADLFSDDAKILNSVRYEDGMTRPWGIPARFYKETLRKNMPAAKKRGDVATYTNVQYTAEGSDIRIKATRSSKLSKMPNPVSFLVGTGGDGKWLILEYLIQTLGGENHGIPMQKPPGLRE